MPTFLFPSTKEEIWKFFVWVGRLCLSMTNIFNAGDFCGSFSDSGSKCSPFRLTLMFASNIGLSGRDKEGVSDYICSVVQEPHIEHIHSFTSSTECTRKQIHNIHQQPHHYS
jgi:hypothetical protein